ncbi:MAG: hypothetical protein ACOX6I_05355 [Syntrophomonadaceae bacterium]|jgi:hypothetical protein
MHMKLDKKCMWLCVLLCALFLTSYLSVLNTTGIAASNMNVFDASSISGGNEHSSMNGEANSRHYDYISATDSSIDFSIFSAKQSRCPVTDFSFNILTAILVAQLISFIYSSRLSDRICTQFNSIRITVFLHKKDGMK